MHSLAHDSTKENLSAKLTSVNRRSIDIERDRNAIRAARRRDRQPARSPTRRFEPAPRLEHRQRRRVAPRQVTRTQRRSTSLVELLSQAPI